MADFGAFEEPRRERVRTFRRAAELRQRPVLDIRTTVEAGNFFNETLRNFGDSKNSLIFALQLRKTVAVYFKRCGSSAG